MVSSEEFHISVTPVGQNDYLVRTEQVAPGVPLAEELVTWPVAEWLTAAGYLMNDPLRSVLQGDLFADQGRESAIARNSVNLLELGQQFYNSLFQGTLRDSWITAQGIAQNQQQVLRLRLGLKDTRLARLPWEVMHAGDRPLATGPYITFSRYQSGILTAPHLLSRNIPTPQEAGGIKVLMVISSPKDQVRLEQKQEALKLQAELQRQISRPGEGNHHLPEIELTILDQPGREELTQALEQGRFHILHYSGHSNLGSNGGEIYLVSRRTGLTETLSGDDLAGLLVNNNIQMAVFNSCLGAYTANADDSGERNLTESLVKRGLRGVLAMSERIPDEVALTLTQLFYRNLSQGYPLDLCVSRVRQGLISAYGSHQTYWALPILYLQREFEGFLNPENTSVSMVELLNNYQPTLQPTLPPTPSAMYSIVPEDSELPLDMEERTSSNLAPDSVEMDFLGEDTWGDLVDEIEYDDPSYDEDFAIVSDLFRQLDHQKATAEEFPLMAELMQEEEDNRLQERQVSEEMTVLEEKLGLRQVFTRSSQTVENVVEAQENSVLLSSPATNHSDRHKLQILSIVGVSAIAILIGVNWWWQSRSWSLFSDIPQIPTQSLVKPQSPPIDLNTAPTGIVTAAATEKMSLGDLQPGLEAVDELLHRGALASAQTALDLVVDKQADDPAVNFRRGRLAWQLVQIGDKKYSIDDARRYWEIAVRDQPDSLEYINALGFAYYAEGNLNRANDSWFRALNLAVKPQNLASNAQIPLNKVVTNAALTSYAGLAIGLYKSANNQPAAKRAQYINEAIKLRQLVIHDNPVDFQVDKLAHNWLWTEKAISDWRSLLQKENQ